METKRTALIYVVIFAAIIVAAIVLYMGRETVYAELNALKLIPQPETFTELYFNDYSVLPKETVANQPISFTFTIHNVEGVTTTYPYTVYFEYPFGREVIFASSSVTLSNNASTTVNVSHTFLASNEQGEVIVNLTQLNQQIDFLLPYNN